MAFNNVSSSLSYSQQLPTSLEKGEESSTTEKSNDLATTALANQEVQKKTTTIDVELSQPEEHGPSATTEKSNNIALIALTGEEVQSESAAMELDQPEDKGRSSANWDSNALPLTTAAVPNSQNHTERVNSPVTTAAVPNSQNHPQRVVPLALHKIVLNGQPARETRQSEIELIKDFLNALLPSTIPYSTKLRELGFKYSREIKCQGLEHPDTKTTEKEIIDTLKNSDKQLENIKFTELSSMTEADVRCMTWLTKIVNGQEEVFSPYFTCKSEKKIDVMMYNPEPGIFPGCLLKIVVGEYLMQIQLDCAVDLPNIVVIAAVPNIEYVEEEAGAVKEEAGAVKNQNGNTKIRVNGVNLFIFQGE